MTITEANAVNRLLDVLTAEDAHQLYEGRDNGQMQELIQSAEVLASKAHKTLQAGWDGLSARRVLIERMLP